MRTSLVRYLSSPAPPGLETISDQALENLFREADNVTTAQQEWSKDLEPPPAKK
jgi:hypothetical protein